MQDTFLEGRVLQRVYRASSDGWGAANFHANCDLKGPCVVYAETEDGYRFGAFNPEGWQSDDDYRNNLNAFLFCWPDQVRDLKFCDEQTVPTVESRRGRHPRHHCNDEPHDTACDHAARR